MLKSSLKALALVPRNVKVLLFTQFMMNTSEFMAVPLMAVYLAQERGLGPGAVGTIMTIAMVTGHALPTFTGALVDRFGFRGLMILGLGFRGVGLLAFPFLSEPISLAVAAAVTGIGAALYESAAYGVFGRQQPGVVDKVFILNNQALNTGAVLGPLIGVTIAGFGTTIPFFLSGCLFIVLGVWCLQFSSLDRDYPSRSSISSSLLSVLKNRRFLLFLIATLPWWFLFSQLFVTFPLHAVALTNDQSAAHYVFVVNGVIGVAFVWLSFLVFRKMRPHYVMVCSYLGLIAIYLLIPVSGSLVWFFAMVALYTIAETLMLPSIELIAAEAAPEGMQSTFFGGLGLAWGVGGSFGYYSGSYLSLDQTGNPYTWVILAFVALIGFCLAAALWSEKLTRVLTFQR